MIDDLSAYKIAITLIPGIGDVNAKRLISYCGGIEAVFKEKSKNLEKIPGIGDVLANSIINTIRSESLWKKVEKELNFCEQYKINILLYTDNEYPYRLKHCEDAPVTIFSLGNVNFNVNKVLSIVGTRKPTHYGISLCENIISDLANLSKDVIIVSGMAFGIDVTAHKAALKYGLKTVGVLAHGLDTIYPYQHRAIAKQIIQQGSLLTEFLSETTPEKSNFVKRNRIIAGMADATLVVESKRDGGAMITAEYAFSYNRDVLAIPGRTFDVTSEGPNYLIKSNKAALVESAQDICQVLSWEINTSKPEQEKLPLLIDLTEEEKKIIEALKNEGDTSIDILALKTAIPMSKISAMLLNLEFNGIVKSLPGKIYALTVKV